MVKLSKNILLSRILAAISSSGWNISLNQTKDHPLRIVITNLDNEEKLLIYIWNITHGGKTRKEDEFRIQITGVNQLVFQEDYKTLLLGLAEIDGKSVFVAFNPKLHVKFGASPSLQVKKETLLHALEHGIAFQEKSKSGKLRVTEMVVAFSPINIIEYIQEIYPQYHDTLQSEEIIKSEAGFIIKNPLDIKISEDEINKLPVERRRVLQSFNKAIRERRFQFVIKSLYNGACAICGLQNNLTEAAHIVAVKDEGTDEITNGVLLCRNHHKAYDSGLIAINEDYKILLNKEYVKRLKEINQDGEINRFLKDSRIGEKIYLPKEEKAYPKKEYLQKNLRSKRTEFFL